jgi:nucleotide sugar dehydrogenase
LAITVVALGKIGLPLAVQFASSGHTVIGADVNPETVALVNAGVAPFPGEAHLQDKFTAAVDAGLISATTDTASAVSQSSEVVIVVPLFVDTLGVPDFGWMDEATRAVAKGLQPGTLVSYETTLPVGTTRDRFGPMLEEGSGLKVGADFHLAFSPERVFTGRVFADLRRYPKIVGGVDADSGQRAVQFYSQVLEFDERDDLPRPNGVWDLGSAEASEMAKLAETTYRDVNIGLANQFARYAADQGIDVHQVIEACNSQPFSHIHQPGIAVGGHCIPIYPRMYLWNDPDATIVHAAREANAQMPSYAAAQVEKHHGTLTGQKVLVLGASYRGGVKETAFSGVFPLVSELQARGAQVEVHDPMFEPAELQQLGLTPQADGTDFDVLIVHTNHAEYATLGNGDYPSVRTVVDGRRILDPLNWPDATLVVLGRGLSQ